MKRLLAARLVIIAAAAAAGLSDASTPIVAVLGVLSLLNTAAMLGTLGPARTGLERVLFGVMGATVSLIVLGLLLNELPGRLSVDNWTTGWAALSAVVLVILASRKATWSDPRSWHVGLRAPWVAPVALVAVAAVAGTVIADAGTRAAARQPLLALSAVGWTRTSADLQINANHVGGAYRLSVRADNRHTNGGAAMRFNFSAHRSTRRHITVSLPPARSFWLITLTPVGRGSVSASRRLILTPPRSKSRSHARLSVAGSHSGRSAS